jgi:hypothetical protein
VVGASATSLRANRSRAGLTAHEHGEPAVARAAPKRFVTSPACPLAGFCASCTVPARPAAAPATVPRINRAHASRTAEPSPLKTSQPDHTPPEPERRPSVGQPRQRTRREAETSHIRMQDALTAHELVTDELDRRFFRDRYDTATEAERFRERQITNSRVADDDYMRRAARALPLRVSWAGLNLLSACGVPKLDRALERGRSSALPRSIVACSAGDPWTAHKRPFRAASRGSDTRRQRTRLKSDACKSPAEIYNCTDDREASRRGSRRAA